MIKKRMPLWAKIILVIVIAAALALTVELFYNIKRLTDSDAGGRKELSLSNVGGENIEIQNNGTLLVKEGGASITFDVNTYVNVLGISYTGNSEAFTQNIIVTYTNYAGKEEKETLADSAPLWLNCSTHNIRKNVKKITLEIPAEKSFTVKGLFIDNTPKINIHRAVIFFMAALAVGLLVVLRSVIGKKTEIGFCIVALSMGFSFIATLPLVRTGFDEETHLRNTYLLTFESQSGADDTIWDMLNASQGNYPYVHCDTAEEYSDFYKYLNDNANYYGTENEEHYTITPRHTSGMATFSYVFMALVMNVCRALKLGFGTIIIAGRITNLIVYTAVMYFAIKILKKGKILMALIGIMPTPLFLASTISYDPVVTSFIYLGMAYVINGLLDENSKILWWQAALAVCAFGFGAAAKAIYAPMILAALFIPKERFKDEKTAKIVKWGVVAAFALLILSFMIPEIVSKGAGGDARGGDTNHGGQLAVILANPLGYAGLLLKSIGTNILRYTIGPVTLDCFPYLGQGNTIIAIDVIIVFAILTYSDSNMSIKRGAKIGIALLAFATAALIWTSMYLAYTEVGVTTAIAGVHGRYFIPLLFPLMMIIPVRKIKTGFNNRAMYNCGLFLAMTGILFWEIYSQVLMACTF